MPDKQANYAVVSEPTLLAWLVRTVWRSVPVAAAGGLLVGLVVFALSGASNGRPTTTARIVLTEEVRWPFFDPVIAQTSELAQADELQAFLATTYDSDTYTLRSEVPDQLKAVVDLVVEGLEVEITEGVAQTAGEWIVEESQVARRGLLEANAAEAARGIADLEEQLSTASASADDATRSLAASDDPVVVEALNRELRLANATIDSYQAAKLTLETTVDDLDRQLSTLAPQVSIASLTTETPGEASPNLALAAAFGAAMLVSIAYIVREREYGRISSVTQVQEVLGVAAAAYPSVPAGGQLVGLFRPLTAGASVTVGVERNKTELATPGDLAGALTSAGILATFAPSMNDTHTNSTQANKVQAGDGQNNETGTDDAETTPEGWEWPSDDYKPAIAYERAYFNTPAFDITPDSGPPSTITLVSLTIEAEHAVATGAACDHVIVVADRSQDAMADLRRRVKLVDDLGIPLLGVLVVETP